MIIKTSIICVFLTLVFIMMQLSTIFVGMDGSNLKGQLENGGFLKPYVQIEASETDINGGENNV